MTLNYGAGRDQAAAQTPPRLTLCETPHRTWWRRCRSWVPGAAWDTRVPLTPSSSALAADANGFLGNTNPPPVPLSFSSGVTQPSRNTYFLLSRISAILTEYNLLSPMLNQGNTFPIFNSACNAPILLQSFWNPNRKTRRQLLPSWFLYI